MSIESKIQSLIDAANDTTGESDTTLTDAVQTLVDGYGQGAGGDYNITAVVTGDTQILNIVDAQGGGGGTNLWSGKYTPIAHEAFDVSFACPGATNFLLVPDASFDLTTGYGFASVVGASNVNDNHIFAITSNNAGTIAASGSNVGVGGSFAAQITFVATGVRMRTTAAVTATSKIPQAGMTYTWFAWR